MVVEQDSMPPVDVSGWVLRLSFYKVACPVRPAQAQRRVEAEAEGEGQGSSGARPEASPSLSILPPEKAQAQVIQR